MIRAQVLSEWVTGSRPNSIAVCEWIKANAPGASAVDVTGQQEMRPDPGILIVEVTCTTEQLAAIEAEYGEAAVLWSEEVEDETIE